MNLEASTATGLTNGFANIDKVIGGSNAGDILVGPDTVNTWKITSNNAGTVNAFAFTSIENLMGRTFADRFIFSKNAGVSGSLVGGIGNNTLDYSAYTSAVNVDLSAGTATNIGGGISNFNVVFGGTAGDTLTGSSGRDFLFGGAGADTLSGGGDGDILFSGTTTFGANAATIDSLLTFWNGGLDYVTRVAELRAGTTGVAGLPKFNSTNVKNDTSFDHLIGGAGLDWFFAKLAAPNADQFSDLDTASGELTN